MGRHARKTLEELRKVQQFTGGTMRQGKGQAHLTPGDDGLIGVFYTPANAKFRVVTEFLTGKPRQVFVFPKWDQAAVAVNKYRETHPVQVREGDKSDVEQ